MSVVNQLPSGASGMKFDNLSNVYSVYSNKGNYTVQEDIKNAFVICAGGGGGAITVADITASREPTFEYQSNYISSGANRWCYHLMYFDELKVGDTFQFRIGGYGGLSIIKAE